MDSRWIMLSAVLVGLMCAPGGALARGGGNWQLLRDSRGPNAPAEVQRQDRAALDLEKAIRDAKTPADHEALAAYYDREAATAHAKAEESRQLAEASRTLAGQGQMASRYRQQVESYERIAADQVALAASHRQIAQALAQQSQ